jgi:hypothetical protein
MRPGRIIAIIVGSVLALSAMAIFIAGGVLSLAYIIESDDGGYFDATLDRLGTPTAAITTGDVDLRTDPGPQWVFDAVDVSVRIQATSVGQGTELFVGIGSELDVETYLSGVARDEVSDVHAGGSVRYDSVPGDQPAASPIEETFWVASASGAGTQILEWDVAEGEWVVVLMNADGSPGILADVTVGMRSGALLAVGVSMLAVGGVLLAIAVAIILAGALSRRAERDPTDEQQDPSEQVSPALYPVRLDARIDTPLSPWLWLVKWFLAIPHYFLLMFLWIAFSFLTFFAGVAILFTARYPKGIFDFNVGVMRWTWRVVYYSGTGGLGTDRYPPFTLGPEPDYPATLEVAYPDGLSRGLVLIKWWLLAIPHYLVLVFIIGGGVGWWWDTGTAVWSGGLVGILVFIAAVILLFTGRYPKPLFDLIIGLNRWAFRVFGYVTLMTDDYPPFRLDQGGRTPSAELEADSLEIS